MPKKSRLTGAEIRSIRSPRRVHGSYFSLSISATAADAVRFACVVSKKVAARAVDRNLLKRRCREIVAKRISYVPSGTYLLYAKKGALSATYKDLERDIVQMLEGVRSASSPRQVQ